MINYFKLALVVLFTPLVIMIPLFAIGYIDLGIFLLSLLSIIPSTLLFLKDINEDDKNRSKVKIYR